MLKSDQALAVVDCAALASIVRLKLSSGDKASDVKVNQELSDLVGLVEWSLPLEPFDMAELQIARSYLENGSAKQALGRVDAVIATVRSRTNGGK